MAQPAVRASEQVQLLLPPAEYLTATKALFLVPMDFIYSHLFAYYTGEHTLHCEVNKSIAYILLFIS